MENFGGQSRIAFFHDSCYVKKIQEVECCYGMKFWEFSGWAIKDGSINCNLGYGKNEFSAKIIEYVDDTKNGNGRKMEYNEGLKMMIVTDVLRDQ